MLKQLKTILNEYADKYNQLTNELNKKIEHLNKNYIGGGDVYIKKLREMKEIYEEDIRVARSFVMKEAENHIQATLSKLNNSITEGITQTMVAELELLRVINPTKEDIEAFLEKYKTCYLACKALKEIADKNNIELEVVTLKDHIDTVELLKEKAFNIINAYNGPLKNYQHELILSGSYIEDISKDIDIFIKEYEQK